MTKEKICERTDEKKYLKRKSPPMSATACPLGMVEKGNDGNKWQVVEVGKSQRWVLCGRANAECEQKSKNSFFGNMLSFLNIGNSESPKSKKVSKTKKAKANKALALPKDCPDGKVLNPKTGRCIKDRSGSKDCPDGKVLNPKTGRCIKDRSGSKVVKKLSTKTKLPSGFKLGKKTTKKESKISKLAKKKGNSVFSRQCEISTDKKYLKRPSPPIPANDCKEGTIREGNDGEAWQIINYGKSNRWVRCGKGKTTC